jgi:hypothetical protein
MTTGGDILAAAFDRFTTAEIIRAVIDFQRFVRMQVAHSHFSSKIQAIADELRSLNSLATSTREGPDSANTR